MIESDESGNGKMKQRIVISLCIVLYTVGVVQNFREAISLYQWRVFSEISESSILRKFLLLTSYKHPHLKKFILKVLSYLFYKLESILYAQACKW